MPNGSCAPGESLCNRAWLLLLPSRTCELCFYGDVAKWIQGGIKCVLGVFHQISILSAMYGGAVKSVPVTIMHQDIEQIPAAIILTVGIVDKGWIV